MRGTAAKQSNVLSFPAILPDKNHFMDSGRSIGTLPFVMRGRTLEHRGIYEGDLLVASLSYKAENLTPISILVGQLPNGKHIVRENHAATPEFEPIALVVGYQRWIEEF